jgi:replicative DNA helicase Mcm
MQSPRDTTTDTTDRVTEAATFLARYYESEVAAVAREPSANPALWVAYDDLYQFDPEFAERLHDAPTETLDTLSQAVPEAGADLPTQPDPVPVRVHGLPETHTYTPTELRHEQGGQYVAVEGVLDRVTTTSDLPVTAAFECQRCGTTTFLPQNLTRDELNEPRECQGCERQGPFRLLPDHDGTEWRDYAQLRVQGEPGADGDASIDGYVLDDLIDYGGDSGLLGRGGEPVTVYGIVERVQKTGRGENELLFDHQLDVRAISFDRDSDDVDVAAHRETFEELAARDDAVDLFAASIVPEHYTTEAWDAALEFAVAYLFGAPRIDIDQGPTYRGDLHMLLVTDYGMGKSAFSEALEQFSPKMITKSATALSSNVGLTAAAVKDDFGDGQWTVKPGLLARASPGHLGIDEIDKGPDDLTAMNDALEGDQRIDVEKAGQSATYESRTSLLAMGNPVDGRFDPTVPVAEQLDMSESLLSRFDGIVTMQDQADKETDAAIAGAYGEAYTEALEIAHGDREERDQLKRPVPPAVGRAWVQYAWDHVQPILRPEQFETLQTWYAEEVRQLNNDFAGDDEGSNMPVPATVRELATACRLSIAFARCHLREEVADTDVERAKSLAKRLIKQHWDGEQFDVSHQYGAGSVTQEERREAVREIIESVDDATLDTIRAVASEWGLDPDRAEQTLKKLAERGDVYSPSGDGWRVV